MNLTQALDRCPTDLLLDGEFRPAADGRTLTVHDPATTAPLAKVASAGEADAVAAVTAAARAQPGWAVTPPRERSVVLRRAWELMTERAEFFATLISAENGKALPDARAEVAYAAEFLRWYAEEAVRLEGTVTRAPAGGHRILVDRAPIGVAVLVTPWNYPAAMATRKIGPALAAGCAVVLKPASDTPLTALAIGALLAEAGVPAGVVNVLPADRSGPVVSTLLAQPAVRKLSFTGSTEVGKVLLRVAADRVLSTSMELGGNAPFLVLADADLDAAVEGAMLAKMRNGGEACTAANRFYVHESLADAFGTRLAAAMAALRMGPGLAPDTEVGPLVNAEAVTKVDELVADAVERGARVLTGGYTPDRIGHYYTPTVLDRVAPGSALLTEEIFGPVAPLVRFHDEDEAIALANATEYGLVSYLYTRDLRRGLALADRLETGMVGLNRGLVSDPAAPFGGVKESGIGREGGHEGILEYTEAKYVATDW
ncbi:NAD-dependent succinate-semialdehyde dehydrogenase [Streptomyces sp. NPDC056716]|uniref:NAD-dependent succinate-semialdehyde dehydrogenase n=1 Tax=unclassified Streptomyces TaxID=2593676 RepID=UPI00367D1CA0